MDETDFVENAFETEFISAVSAAKRSSAEIASTPISAHQPPVTLRELVSVVGITALFDVTVYRGGGYAGFAALMAGVPLLLWFGSPLRRTMPYFRFLTFASRPSGMRTPKKNFWPSLSACPRPHSTSQRPSNVASTSFM